MSLLRQTIAMEFPGGPANRAAIARERIRLMMRLTAGVGSPVDVDAVTDAKVIEIDESITRGLMDMVLHGDGVTDPLGGQIYGAPLLAGIRRE